MAKFSDESSSRDILEEFFKATCEALIKQGSDEAATVLEEGIQEEIKQGIVNAIEDYRETLDKKYDIANKGDGHVPRNLQRLYRALGKEETGGLSMGAVKLGTDLLAERLAPSLVTFMQNRQKHGDPNDQFLTEAYSAVREAFTLLAGPLAAADGHSEYEEDLNSMMKVVFSYEDTQSVFRNLETALKLDAPAQWPSAFQKVVQQAKTLCESQPYMEHIGKDLQILPMVYEAQKQHQPSSSSKAEAGVKTRDLSRFRFEQPKRQGREPGIIVKKEVDNADNPNKKKYDYTWMVKHQSAIDTVTEKLSADIYRYFIKDNAPKVRLVGNEDQTDAYLASRFIENFRPLYQVLASIPDERMRNDKGLEIKGSLRIVAVSALLGNYDIHHGNRGLVIKGAGSAPEAAIVDFGRSLNFRAGFDGFTRKDNKHTLPGAITADTGESFRPEDMIRSLHGGHFKISSRNFCTLAFAEALETVAGEVETGVNALASIVMNSAGEVHHSYSNYSSRESLEKELGKIAKGTTLNNLGKKILSGLQERAVMMREFAFNIGIQCALQSRDTESLKYLLESRPEALNQPIRWLTEDDSERMYPPSTIREFAQANGCSKEIMAVIKAAELSLPSVTPAPEESQVASQINALDDIEGIDDIDEQEFIEEEYQLDWDSFPNAANHMNAVEVAQKVADAVYDREDIGISQKNEVIYHVLHAIYDTVPEAGDAEATGHPVCRQDTGEIHRMEGWEEAIETLVDIQAKNLGKETHEEREASEEEREISEEEDEIDISSMPHAMEHMRVDEVVRKVAELVIRQEGIEEAREKEVILNVLHTIYDDVPTGQHLAQVQGNPVYFNSIGDICNSVGWEKAIEKLVKAQVPQKGQGI